MRRLLAVAAVVAGASFAGPAHATPVCVTSGVANVCADMRPAADVCVYTGHSCTTVTVPAPLCVTVSTSAIPIASVQTVWC